MIPAMMPEAYVIGSIVLSVIVVAILYPTSRSPSMKERLEESLRCPRCGAELREKLSDIEKSVWSSEWLKHVVPEIRVITCSKCGYQIRSW